jgi:hypothetical protein
MDELMKDLSNPNDNYRKISMVLFGFFGIGHGILSFKCAELAVELHADSLPFWPYFLGVICLATACLSAYLLASVLGGSGHHPAHHRTMWGLLLTACAMLPWQAYRWSYWETFLSHAPVVAIPPLILLILLHLLRLQQRNQV